MGMWMRKESAVSGGRLSEEERSSCPRCRRRGAFVTQRAAVLHAFMGVPTVTVRGPLAWALSPKPALPPCC